MPLPLWEQEKNFFKIAPDIMEALFTYILLGKKGRKKHKQKWAEHYLGRINHKINTRQTTGVTRKTIPPALRHEVFKRDGYRCLECGVTNKESRLNVDHIIPVSQGGTDELDNLQTLCQECNLSKFNKHW